MAKLEIYTDGGCTGNPGPGGWAAVILRDSEATELSGGAEATTNNQMELTAVIRALESLSAEESQASFSIYTDSQYVKNGINSWIVNWERNGWKTAAKKPVKNKEYWVRLRELTLNKPIQWHWVKGHSGNEWNERCDSLVETQRMKFG